MSRFTFASVCLFITAVFCSPKNSLSQGQLWGMTSEGGTDNNGVIFRLNDDGTDYVVEHSFKIDTPGTFPRGSVLLASNGKLYGTTSQGGFNNQGVLFEYDPVTKVYTKKIDFNGKNGWNPNGILIQATNSKIYGMADGGAIGRGIIFEFDVSSNKFKQSDFEISNGSFPQGGLTQSSNGKLYGMTWSGGINGNGVIFEYDYAGEIIITKFDFDYLNGASPFGEMVEAANGKLYGMTSGGGTNGLGVLFQFDPSSGSVEKKLDFDGTMKGANPDGRLMFASSGKLLGVTSRGGTEDLGVIFEYDPISENYVKKFDFSLSAGANPNGNLALHSNGKLYGMTHGGGLNNFGVLFEFDPLNGNYVKKVDLDYSTGIWPYGGLNIASGKLYGTTSQGGIGVGSLFEYDPTTENILTVFAFNTSLNGSNPSGSLLLATNGKIYGITNTGGSSNNGVLFEYDPSNGDYSKKHDFPKTTSSSSYGPNGGLIQTSSGMLYGMTSGNEEHPATLYAYDIIAGNLKEEIIFNSFENGAYPAGRLLETANGKLYGLTYAGGVSNNGVLFEFNPQTKVYSKKYEFAIASEGNLPNAGPIQASNGKIYATTNAGGLNYYGVIFEFDPGTGNYVKKSDFDVLSGQYPGALTEIAEKLYGTISDGGVYRSGTIFEFNFSTGIILKKIDLKHDIDGSRSHSLTKSPNDILFGTATNGGVNESGTIFKFNPKTGEFLKIHDFNKLNGSHPKGGLIYTNNLTTGDIFDSGKLSLNIYPNPTSQSLTVTFGDVISKKVVSLYQLNGKRMDWKESSNESIEFNVEGYSPGIYFIKVATQNSVEVLRFVKQ